MPFQYFLIYHTSQVGIIFVAAFEILSIFLMFFLCVKTSLQHKSTPGSKQETKILWNCCNFCSGLFNYQLIPLNLGEMVAKQTSVQAW